MESTAKDGAGTPVRPREQASASESSDHAVAISCARKREDGKSREWTGHPVDIRITIPLPFRSFYVTIVAGPERRGKQRRADERKTHPLLTIGNVIVCLVAGSIFGLAALGLIELLFAHAVSSGSLVTALLTGLLLLAGVVACIWLLVRRLFETAHPSGAAEPD